RGSFAEKRKNMMRLRTAAILLSAAAFSFSAVPALMNSVPDGVSDKVSYYIKVDFAFSKETYAGTTVSEEQTTVAATDKTYQRETQTPVSTTETPLAASTSDTEIKTVQAVNLSRYEVTDTPRLILMNETAYKPDLDSLAYEYYAFEKPEGDAPLVLVVHTHGTESYLPDGVETYTDDTKYRSTDSELNVVGVGNAFCAELEKHGIATVHDVTMHDEEDFNNAYARSRSAMKKYLAEYPSIKYIVDIHRDTVFNDSRENKKPIVYIDGEATAQVMLVIGTDESGSSHKDWKTNLILGAKLQRKFNEYPTFARPVYLRKASYNQQLSAGAFLLEVGSCGNTVAEAKRAAVIAAKQFADLILNG
ncbi:MAG: stage II sporulation protein P, partial [Clostridia bacterium]|nr:stage II sporulation protein P [Clostridia bacterium]